ncbi:MAG: hypothetical protein KDD48_00540 [Bdellovibrionales bacterium]|nr:hypothetical protein [Bdellovibrionales bacterium]
MKRFHPELMVRPQVVLKEDEGELSLAVHLGSEIVDRVREHGWSNLELHEFMTAAEEISHFLYLGYSATQDKQVSLLDVEVQAEIDKFLLALHYFPDDEEVITRLFERIHWREGLTKAEEWRYREANRLGLRMATWINQNVREGTMQSDTVEFLRLFYRMETTKRLSKVEKMKRI